MAHDSLLSKACHRVKCGDTLVLMCTHYPHPPTYEYAVSFELIDGTFDIQEDTFDVQTDEKQEGASSIVEWTYTLKQPARYVFRVDKLYGNNKILWTKNINVIVEEEDKELKIVL